MLLMKRKNDKMPVVIRTFDMQNDQADIIRNEILVPKAYKHPLLNKVYDSFRDSEDVLHLVCEMPDKGNLK